MSGNLCGDKGLQDKTWKMFTIVIYYLKKTRYSPHRHNVSVWL